MIKLIRYLLGLCNHTYNSIETREICKYIRGREEVIGYHTVALCSRCAHMKQSRLTLDK